MELAANPAARQGKTDAALARLALCSRQSPRPERWLVRRGEVFLQAGRFPEARREFSEARPVTGILTYER